MLLSSEFTLVAASVTPSTVTAGVAPVDEVQSLTVDATGGTFTVTYAGQTTSALNFDVSAVDFTTALEALSNLAPGDVVVTGGPGDSGGTTPYTLTFGGTLAGTNVAQITASGASLTGGAGTATPATVTPGVVGVNEEQRLTIVGNDGSFTVSYGGDTTDPISLPLVQADVQTAIDDLGGGDITATVASATVIDLEFVGALAETNVSQVTASATGLYNSQLVVVGQGHEGCAYFSTEDAISIGGQSDNADFPLPDASVSGPLELDIVLKQEVWANGAGTLHVLETNLSSTPEL